jgi:hypothetical protein
MRKYQNKLNTENKPSKVTTALLNSRTDHMVEMTITNDLTPHTVGITTKTNVHKMIMDNHPREITPTPTRAVRAAQVITGGATLYDDKKEILDRTTTPNSMQHHRNSSNTCSITQTQYYSSRE